MTAKRGLKIALAGGLGVLLVAAIVASVAVQRALAPAAESDAPVLFAVARGETLSSIAHNLEARGLVRDARSVIWLARWRSLAGELRAGEYLISPAQDPGEILARIAAGEVETYEVVLPEGLTARQIGERLEAAQLVVAEDFDKVVRDPAVVAKLGVEGPTLEGYLFPETYRLPRGLSAEEVAHILVSQFRETWLEIAPAAREQELSMLEVVTLASIVEKETGAANERPLIAAVFRNRLRKGMRLETDPTVIYGIPDFDGNLRRRDLENRDNPYNTYKIRGLPPGPIASPGANALRAVVEPADADYLYFVSRNDGTHKFSRTYREHVVAVNTFKRHQRRR